MQDVKLLTDEYIEDLQFDGLHIILSKSLPSFTTDAVLLSDFARVKKTDNAADLGTGTGILPLLMHGRYGMKMTAFELQPKLCDMARRSFLLNGLDEILTAVNMDCREAYREYNGVFSAIVCNPPYFSGGLNSCNFERSLTRSQVDADLNDFLTAAKRLLKSGGRFYCCYPAKQLTELLYFMRANALEPKCLRFVKSTPSNPPYLVLVEARKDGGHELSFMPDLVICDENGNETDEIRKIYHRC